MVVDVSSTIGKMGLSCINMSLSHFYVSHSHYKTRLILSIRDSHTSDLIAVAAQAVDLIKTEEVEAIIGAITSTEANFMMSLGHKTHVPIITFTATSPSLDSLKASYFFRIAQSDSAQVNAITSIVEAFGWKAAVPIYIDNDYGKGAIPFFTNSLQQLNVRIPYQYPISPLASDSDITAELYKLMTMQTRVFLLHITHTLGSRLFTIAKQIGMMQKGYVWIVTTALANLLNALDSSVKESMQGVLGVRTYVPQTKRLEDFRVRWKRQFVQDNPTLVDENLNVFGLWAYDSATALAMAVEKAGTNNIGFNMSNAWGNSSTDLERFGISNNGEKLREALSNTRYSGLSGEFSIAKGQLQASTFEIINVIGDTDSIPKGWEIPTNGKKLRIGVQQKGYNEFVKVTRDPNTNTIEVTGFSIDIFKAVLEKLPYALPYEFIPFSNHNESHSDLVRKVFYRKLDAVVGDSSIIARRLKYVDFTMPYTESGEKVVSNLGRFVLIIWVIVGLILVQSYTANLTSLLTVEQLTPTVTDMNLLLNNRLNVGYLKGSFVYAMLKDKGFQERQLKSYNSPQECHDLFTKGSANGGISAAFDEIPYVKLFLGIYCSMYVMVGPTLKTGGFGFVFPKGSPLVADISRAILNVTQGDKMKTIENAWLKTNSCPESSTSSVSSNSLGLESFWGLFLITGVASMLALIIFAIAFLYEHRNILFSHNPNTSIWRRIRIFLKIFDQRDQSSQTFRRKEMQDKVFNLCWAQRNTTVAVKVGIVVDVSATIGKVALSCIHMALSHSHYNTTILFIIRHSSADVLSTAAHAADLIKTEQVEAIIGPTTSTSTEANFLITLGHEAHIPIITFSPTTPSLQSPYFFHFSQMDSAQVDAISAIVEAFGWKSLVPIYVDNDYGKGLIPFLINSLQNLHARIPYLSPISPSATDEDIRAELYKLMAKQTRVFLVHASIDLGSKLFLIANQIGMMRQGYVWIITDGMANVLNSLNSSVIESMHGVLGVRTYIPQTRELDDFKVEWKRKFVRDNPDLVDTNLNAFGVWAYDATTALAMAVQKLGVSLNGERLREALSNTKFRGLSGEFNVVDGKLQASTFEIINVIGNGERRVAFWTSQNGLVKNLDLKNKSINDTSKDNVAPIIWPGDTYCIPKGWEIPTNGKKMKIGVPVRRDYTEFVKITRDPITNTTIEVTGFCIDVFKAVLELLPYALPYEFVPFAKPNGESAGTYDELISQVYYGVQLCRFHIALYRIWGYYDCPNEIREKAECVGLLKAIKMGSLEEKVVSNLGRFVVIIWMFVVQIVVQSYTASLTSLLTVEQLRPSITDVHQLVKNRLNVGCKKGSFEQKILKDLGVEDYQFKFFNSKQECNELLTKGSEKGGISASFGEIPYVKLFLQTYCSKYTMVDPQFKTGGLGFVFPKGSPLVGDISRAILNVTQGDKIKTIEKRWFKNGHCTQSGASISSNSLGLESFWGLFMIAGVASVLALIVFTSTFLYEYRQIWLWHDPNTPIRTRIQMLLKMFTQRDERCHTLKKSKTWNDDGLGEIEASRTTTYCPPSPNSEETHSKFSATTSTTQELELELGPAQQ
ncbi:glutamate receptor 2.7-like [Senna tora]|uniref:Glutamate receptor 2.7-like n=1 Tax=Senna tora TaxID=362788 RepID=A0A834TY25_9FABA|nr:glutamate receptor 2.7-like [Senna tora]